jgi:hypothetical protein
MVRMIGQNNMMNKLVCGACLFLVLLSSACGKAPEISVFNGSSVTISGISLKGNGFFETIRSLEPGGTVSIAVYPKGETTLAIQFDTPEGKKQKSDFAYFEASGGYRVTVEINDRFEISAKVTIGGNYGLQQMEQPFA